MFQNSPLRSPRNPLSVNDVNLVFSENEFSMCAIGLRPSVKFNSCATRRLWIKAVAMQCVVRRGLKWNYWINAETINLTTSAVGNAHVVQLLTFASQIKSAKYSLVIESTSIIPSSWQSACRVSHKPGDRLPLLSARPAVTLATLRGLLPVSLLGEQKHDGCEQFA